MQVLSDLIFKGSGAVLDHLTEFPSSPQDGQMCLVDGIVYIYTKLGTMTTWYPLSNKTGYFVHNQGMLGTLWTIEHNQNTSNFLFFVYDENNKLIVPTYNYVDDNTFKLEFTEAKKGKAVVFVAAERYVPSFTSDNFVSRFEYDELKKKVQQIELGMV